ncbi:Copper transporter 1 [Morus notabilis]|uniref:Copper transport protein n=1 Tax=Morus notabilis TaxID=981085 RepID=W9QE78_9ROSA|nr:copper transporter 1 [Morus notabilis]EXB30466.1 Copper transporter 1 [Morus notabilis]
MESQSIVSSVLALTYVFSLCLAIEWISHARLSSDNNVKAGLLQTFMYGVRVGLAYLVMLEVMSFNSCILLAAIAGYSVGFLVFGNQMFRRSKIVPDLPPLNC